MQSDYPHSIGLFLAFLFFVFRAISSLQFKCLEGIKTEDSRFFARTYESATGSDKRKIIETPIVTTLSFLVRFSRDDVAMFNNKYLPPAADDHDKGKGKENPTLTLPTNLGGFAVGMMCATRFFFASLFFSSSLLPFSGSQRGSLFYRAPFSYFRSAGFCSSYDRMVCVFVNIGLFVRFSRRFSFLLLLLISEASIDDDGDHAKYRFHCLKCVCMCVSVLCCSTKDNYLSCVRLCSIFRSCLSLPNAPCTAPSQSRSVMRRAA